MPNRGSRTKTHRLYELCVEQQGNASCRICGAPPPAWPGKHTVDHINGKSDDDRPQNVRLACRGCNGLLGNLKRHHPDVYRRIRSSDGRIRAHFGMVALREKFSETGARPEPHNGHADGVEPGGVSGDIYTYIHTPGGERHQRPTTPPDKAVYDEMIRAFWDEAQRYIEELGGRASAKAVREIAAMRVLKRTGLIIKPQTQRAYIEWACCEEGPFAVPDDDPTAVTIRPQGGTDDE